MKFLNLSRLIKINIYKNTIFFMENVLEINFESFNNLFIFYNELKRNVKSFFKNKI